MLHPAPLGALTQLYAGTSETSGFNGKVCINLLFSVGMPLANMRLVGST